MIRNILRQYFSNIPWLMPVDVDVITPSDYHLYLYASETLRIEAKDEEPKKWYVLVEADYLGVESVVVDVERSFSVKVQGWCVLKEHQKEAGTALLPPDAFVAYDNSNESDWKNYHHVIYNDGEKYALLEVIPQVGVSINDFGLSYFSDSDESPQ